MTRTLFSRLFPVYLIAVTLSLALLGGLTIIALYTSARTRANESLEASARLLAQQLPDLTQRELSWTAEILDSVGIAKSFVILDGEGGAVYSNRALQLPLAAVRLQSSAGWSETDSLRTAAGSRVEYAVAYASDNRWVLLAQDRYRLTRDARRAFLGVLVAVGLFVLAIGLLLYRLLRSINDPILEIQTAARQMAQGNLNIRVAAGGPPELRDLASDLDQMAHELRTRIAAISRQRNQLEAILTSMLEGVVVLDDARSIVSMNEAAGTLLNVPSDQATGRTLIDYLRNAQLDELAELALREGRPIERTVTLYREQPLHLQVHATPLSSADGVVGSLLVMNDITRLVQLETLRKDFVANVSHELKTPITSIKGFVETLIDAPDSETTDRVRYLGIILNHTNRLNAIIEDLLSLSRLEQADQRITFREFPLDELVASVVDTCRLRASERSIDVETVFAGSNTGWGNPNLIEQALVNLLDNALKYSPNGSRVKVRVTNAAGSLRFEVEDNGQGIPARDLPRIFERFYRTDRARSRELGGTGLGLAIVKHIGRAHRGTVGVESVYGEGSTFSIEIPQDVRTDA
ncbi:MAG: ATP-binding protein [Spirochaetales bacterium]